MRVPRVPMPGFGLLLCLSPGASGGKFDASFFKAATKYANTVASQTKGYRVKL
jgi:hypothetical protein